MKPGATEEQVKHVIDLVRGYGLTDDVIHGTGRTVVAYMRKTTPTRVCRTT